MKHLFVVALALFALCLAGCCLSDDPPAGPTWVERTSAGTRDWHRLASSADGLKLAAAVLNGPIYTSHDGGVS